MTLTMMNGGVKVESVVAETPSYVVTPRFVEETKPPGGSIQRKHVYMMVGAVILAGLIITGILVGMHIFAEAQKEIVKFSLDFKSSSDGGKMKQEVESDPNDNVVMYHVMKNGQDVYVVNDFNRDMQVVKVENSVGTNCYVSALNRTAALDPSHINGAESLTGSDGLATQTYLVSTSPVTDRSFLPKKALDMCSGVSVYWAYRSCASNPVDQSHLNTTSPTARNRRDIYYMGSYYGLPGLGGCCWAYFACQVQMTETITGIYHECQTYVWTNICCGAVAYPYCQNFYYGYWSTPGLVC
jgi:hypothetical protein